MSDKQSTPSLPPRVSMGYRKGSRQPFVTTQPLMDCQNHVYLSELEHEQLLREAVAKAWEEAAKACWEGSGLTDKVVRLSLMFKERAKAAREGGP